MSLKLTYDYVKEQLKDKGFELISTQYINAVDELKIQCNNGHIIYKTYNYIQQNNGCQYCSNKHKYNINEIQKTIEKDGYKLISTEYKNNKKKIKLECPSGHIYNVSYSNFLCGYRCPRCSQIKGGSNTEKELLRYIKTFYNGKIIENDRSIVFNHTTNKQLELDFYFPNLMKAIEFGHRYYHKSNNDKQKEKIKKRQCLKHNIKLLILIYEGEWYKEKTFIFEKVKEFLLT